MWLYNPLFKNWTPSVSRRVFGCSLGSKCARQPPFRDCDPSIWTACSISWVFILPRIGVLTWEDGHGPRCDLSGSTSSPSQCGGQVVQVAPTVPAAPGCLPWASRLSVWLAAALLGEEAEWPERL